MRRARPMLVLLSFLLTASPLTAQNPWTRVPAFPTVCYTAGDPFVDRIEAAYVANQEALGRQVEINQGLNQQLKGLDPAAKQSRMMAYMQQNQAGFQAYMQLAAQDPQSAQAASEAHLARMQAFQTEFDALLANYAAALKATLDPVNAEMMKVTDAASGASNAERAAAIAKYNSTYQALCGKWITKEDFPAFLTKFKAYLVGDYLPSLRDEVALEKTTLEMSGISTRDYQHTAPLDAVARYIEYVREVFKLRERKPLG